MKKILMNDYKGVYETTGNANNVTQLANIISNNPGFEITIQKYLPQINEIIMIVMVIYSPT